MKALRKRVFALALAFVMMLSLILVSCGNDEAPTDENSSSVIEITDTSSSENETTTEETTMKETTTEETTTEETTMKETTTEETTSEETSEESSSEEPDPVDPLEEEVNALLETKHRLTFNEDGSFRVLILADAHMNYKNLEGAKLVRDRIKLLVDRNDPDLVIFTGDNVIGATNSTETRINVLNLVQYIEEKQIPWCHVYGNHDHEGGYPNILQQNVYESFEYCISKTGEDLSGVGNYVHAIYNQDGTVGAAIYCLDSGAYDVVNGGYDYIKEDQIAWYKETSELLQEYNDGKVVPALMAFHIPLIENNYAYNNRDNTEIVTEYTGQRNESICASATDTLLFETILERGDVTAIVTGHDHVNDYMYKMSGIKLCAAPNMSDLTYYNPDVQGARVFDLNLETIDDMITYVDYLIERLDPDDYDAFASGTELEISQDKIDSASKTGYNNSGLEGTVTVSSAEGKGQGGGDAIEITRSQTGNFEVKIDLDTVGKLGENKYLIVWMDLSSVDFRKACVGLISSEGKSSPYRTDDKDTPTEFYYLPDGADSWKTLSHGGDGCFGVGDSGSQTMEGKKGYFAFPIEYFLNSSRSMSEDTLITGFYLYADIKSADYANTPFYIDAIALTDDYAGYIK